MPSEHQVPQGWQLRGDELFRRWEFSDFATAFAFMTEVAARAEAHDHHPDWSNSYGIVEIVLKSHDVGTVTERDIRLATAINELR